VCCIPTRILPQEIAVDDLSHLSPQEREVYEDILASGIAQIVHFQESTEESVAHSRSQSRRVSDSHLPIVQMHGMGDYATNSGMVSLKNMISKYLNGTYVTNVALGSNMISDMMGSFTETMNEEVNVFAAAVRADAKLAGGFNAIGYSQGALIIRGYIEKYNNPPVKVFASIHGPLAGVAGFPRCNFSSSICRLFDSFLGAIAYNSFSQSILAQANYLRDPLRIPQYLAGNTFLPLINNENAVNQTYAKNFQSLDQLVCVKALQDTMVIPNESEWFGFYQDGSIQNVLSMESTAWYQQDLFGLKTLNMTGRFDTKVTPGDHLQFTQQFLMELLDEYF